jgi:hypothetical protein
MTRQCLDCKQEISGRRDKKFCSDQCRVNYHNTIAQEKLKAFRKIHKILLKNRNILSDLSHSKFSVFSRLQLQNAGFNFKYHTHVLLIDGKKLTFTYDYGYVFVKLSQIKIISLADFEYSVRNS